MIIQQRGNFQIIFPQLMHQSSQMPKMALDFYFFIDFY
jgi:hypothetical protein